LGSGKVRDNPAAPEKNGNEYGWSFYSLILKPVEVYKK
jgi:hypothetical protein